MLMKYALSIVNEHIVFMNIADLKKILIGVHLFATFIKNEQMIIMYI